jgi:L-cystine uptake protein TcyP (sodium:dicarboxylate symporter family)
MQFNNTAYAFLGASESIFGTKHIIYYKKGGGDVNINETIAVPVIMSLVQIAKGLGMPKKFSAAVAVVIGALIGVFFIEPQNIRIGIFKGIVYGLTASGLYSGTKNTFEQVKPKKTRSTKQK